LRAKRSNLGFNEINVLEIAASLTLLAMTTKNGFFRILLVIQSAFAASESSPSVAPNPLFFGPNESDLFYYSSGNWGIKEMD